MISLGTTAPDLSTFLRKMVGSIPRSQSSSVNGASGAGAPRCDARRRAQKYRSWHALYCRKQALECGPLNTPLAAIIMMQPSAQSKAFVLQQHTQSHSRTRRAPVHRLVSVVGFLGHTGSPKQNFNAVR